MHERLFLTLIRNKTSSRSHVHRSFHFSMKLRSQTQPESTAPTHKTSETADTHPADQQIIITGMNFMMYSCIYL